jgi:hypothetical protein
MTIVRIVVDNEHRTPVHEYEAGPASAPRPGDHIDYNGQERLVTKVVWDFLELDHGVEPEWVNVLIEPSPADRED